MRVNKAVRLDAVRSEYANFTDTGLVWTRFSYSREQWCGYLPANDVAVATDDLNDGFACFAGRSIKASRKVFRGLRKAFCLAGKLCYLTSEPARLARMPSGFAVWDRGLAAKAAWLAVKVNRLVSKAFDFAGKALPLAIIPKRLAPVVQAPAMPPSIIGG